MSMIATTNRQASPLLLFRRGTIDAIFRSPEAVRWKEDDDRGRSTVAWLADDGFEFEVSAGSLHDIRLPFRSGHNKFATLDPFVTILAGALRPGRQISDKGLRDDATKGEQSPDDRQDQHGCPDGHEEMEREGRE